MDSSQEQGKQNRAECCYMCIRDLVKKWPKLFNQWVFRLLTGIYFILTIFITGTPFWTAELIQDSFTFMGLWSICHPKACNRIKVSDETLNLLRIFTIIALSCGFLAVLGSWNVFFRILRRKSIENAICAVVFFIAGISLKTAVGVVHLHTEEHVFLNFYLAIFLSLLAILLGVSSVLRIFYGRQREKRLSVPQIFREETRQ